MGGGPGNPDHPPVDDQDEDYVHANPNESNLKSQNLSISSQNLKNTDSTHVRLLFSKSKVYVHPTPNSSDQIPGFLCIVQMEVKSYLLAWIPESLLNTEDYEAYVQVESTPLGDNWDESETVYVSAPPPASADYASSTNLNDIYSIIVTKPALSENSWYGSITVNLALSGISLPTFWFHDDECSSTIMQRNNPIISDTGTSSHLIWGGDELIIWLRKIANVIQSNFQENLLLINPSREDIAIHTSSLFDDEAIDRLDSNTSPNSPNPFHMDPLISAVKEVKWNILERFSQVAKFSRDAAHTVLDSPVARPFRQHIPHEIAHFAYLNENNSCQQSTSRTNAVGMTVREYDSARVYLAHWAAGLAESAARERRKEARPDDNVEGWEESTALGIFEALGQEDGIRLHVLRTKPVSLIQWKSYFANNGTLKEPIQDIKMHIFHGGLDVDVRPEVWPFLLGLFPWNSDESERKIILNNKKKEYFKLKEKWWGHNDDSDEYFHEQKARIEKDVMRTDRTIPFYAGEDRPADPNSSAGTAGQGTNDHLETLKEMLLTFNYYNTELGYVQGMSDLLAPIYSVLDDEVMGFWCFVGFMERLQYNFYRDQSGMRRQLMTLNHLIQLMDPQLYKHLEVHDSLNLFFCFRWILIWFKREFEWNDIQRLWEVLWSDHYSTQFHLFVALAILDRHSSHIIDHLRGFDEILKFINDLNCIIDLEATLIRAEELFIKFKKLVNTIDAKRTEQQVNKVRVGSTPDEQGLRKRRQGDKQFEIDESSTIDESESIKLPVISESLRELLRNDLEPNVEWKDTLSESVLETPRNQ